MKVAAGATVTWTNFDGADPHLTRTGLSTRPTCATGDAYEVTFDEAGAYEYFCKFHPPCGRRSRGG